MEDIYSGKSIWDEDASSWVEQLMEQAEEEAREMKEQEKYLSEQQIEEEDEDDFLMQEDEDNFIDEDYVPLKSKSSTYNNTKNSDGFGGIYKVEGAKTGQPTNLNSSAIGRGQMVKGTRYAMYKKLGIDNIEQAEQAYRTNPDFEEQVNNAYREELSSRIPSHIQGKEREYMIAKGWYTGNPFYDDNKVPHPEAGNRITAGEYARRAVKQYGGEFIPSGMLKKAQYSIRPKWHYLGDENSEIEYEYGDAGIDLPEVTITGKRNNSGGTLLDTPLNELQNKYKEMKNEEKAEEFLYNTPEKAFDFYTGMKDLQKNISNRFVDTINNSLDNTIGLLADRQNQDNMREYQKRMNELRFTNTKQNPNKKTAYI